MALIWVAKPEGPLLFAEFVEGEVQVEDVYPRFAKEAQLAVGCVAGDELTDAGLVELARLGNAGSLEVCGVRGDVGIESGAGGGDQVDGHGMAGILFGERVDGGLDAVDEGLVGLGEIGAAG